MKKVFLTVFAYCLISAGMLLAANKSFAADAFVLNGANLKTAVIDQSFTGTDELTGYHVTLEDRTAIFGAGVSAEVTLSGAASLARVVLIDNAGDEYLIYEVSSLIAEKNTISVSNVCEETKLLNAVIPVSVRVELFGATLNLRSVSTVASVSYTRNEMKEYQQIIRAEQEQQKISFLNTMIRRKGMNWTAGQNSLSSLTYAQKKMMFSKNGMLANLQGFEYHVAGVFELRSNTPDVSVPPVRAMIDSFDWRKRHGATDPKSPYYDGDAKGTGWDTKIKDQAYPQYCGSCWAHSTLASAEMLANLYYNTHIDMDLSEQYLMECSNACSAGKGCGGGNPSTASKWVVDKGAMEESAFPYVASDAPVCGDTIKNPIENLHYAATIRVSGSSATDDSLKRFIVHYGPLNVGISSMSHAMSMVGYKKDAGGATVWIFKNSHGLSSGTNGYRDVKPGSLSDFSLTAYKLPVKSRIYADKDIRCVDLDKDGYYNWGVGPKPATCPQGCPNEEDCDDSKSNLGPMLADGSCKEIPTDIQLINLPDAGILFTSSPNPFKQYTTINFSVTGGLSTVIRIYDMSGSIMREFTMDHSQDGLQQLRWDGTDRNGALIGNGMYLCKIEMNVKESKISKYIKLFISR